MGIAGFKVAQDVLRRQGPLEELVKVLSHPKRAVVAKRAFPAGCLVLVPESWKVSFKDYDAKHSEDWVRVHVSRGSLLERTSKPTRVIVLEQQFSDKDFAGKRLFPCPPGSGPPTRRGQVWQGGAGRRTRHLPLK